MKKFISIFLLLYITLPINAQDKTNELSGFIIHKQENGSNGSLEYLFDLCKRHTENNKHKWSIPFQTHKNRKSQTHYHCNRVSES